MKQRIGKSTMKFFREPLPIVTRDKIYGLKAHNKSKNKQEKCKYFSVVLKEKVLLRS